MSESTSETGGVPEWAITEAYPFAAYEYDDVAVHTDHIARALLAAYRRGREDAARVCDAEAERHGRWVGTDNGACERTAEECAAAIRAAAGGGATGG